MTSVNTMSIFPLQVTAVDESMIERSAHTVTAITISFSLVVVVVFGGRRSVLGNLYADTVVLEFGEYTIVMKQCCTGVYDL